MSILCSRNHSHLLTRTHCSPKLVNDLVVPFKPDRLTDEGSIGVFLYPSVLIKTNASFNVLGTLFTCLPVLKSYAASVQRAWPSSLQKRASVTRVNALAIVLLNDYICHRICWYVIFGLRWTWFRLLVLYDKRKQLSLKSFQAVDLFNHAQNMRALAVIWKNWARPLNDLP